MIIYTIQIIDNIAATHTTPTKPPSPPSRQNPRRNTTDSQT